MSHQPSEVEPDREVPSGGSSDGLSAEETAEQPSLKEDIGWLFWGRLSVLFVVLLIAACLLMQFGESIFVGVGIELSEFDARTSAPRSALLCMACFSGAAIANVVGRRRGHSVGGAMIAISLRTGGVAVLVLAIWLAFGRDDARGEIAMLGTMYVITLIADTLAWLFETKTRSNLPQPKIGF